MCIAIPGKVIELEKYNAFVDFGAIKKWVNVNLIDDLSINDYILVHAGYGVIKIDEDQALETLSVYNMLINN